MAVFPEYHKVIRLLRIFRERAFWCKVSTTFLIHQNKNRTLSCPHRHETQGKRTDGNEHHACLRGAEDVKTMNPLGGNGSGYHESKMVLDDSWPMTFSERRPAFNRVSSHVRSCLVPRALVPRPAFAKRYRDCIGKQFSQGAEDATRLQHQQRKTSAYAFGEKRTAALMPQEPRRFSNMRSYGFLPYAPPLQKHNPSQRNPESLVFLPECLWRNHTKKNGTRQTRRPFREDRWLPCAIFPGMVVSGFK